MATKREFIEKAALGVFKVGTLARLFADAWSSSASVDIDFRKMVETSGVYTEASVRVVMSKNRKWLTRGDLIKGEVVRRIEDEAERLQGGRADANETLGMAEVSVDLPLQEHMVLTDIQDALWKNPRLNFVNEEKREPTSIDFERRTLQHLRIVCNNRATTLPFIVRYRYECTTCGMEAPKRRRAKSAPHCPEEDCKGRMRFDADGSFHRPAEISFVNHEGFKLPMVSLAAIPQGESIVACFLLAEEKGYSLFAVDFQEARKKDTKLSFHKGVPRVYQLLDAIDENCREWLPNRKYIVGMEAIKLSVLLSVAASLRGWKSFNVLLVGDHGVGKTTTAKYVLFSALPLANVKAIRMRALTDPGIRGSERTLSFGDQRIPVHEDGVYTRCDAVLVDEFYDDTEENKEALKTVVGSDTIAVEVSGLRESPTKRAITIATANPHPRSMKNLDKLTPGGTKSRVSRRKMERFSLCPLDGENVALLDRFGLCFYIKTTKEVHWDPYAVARLSDNDLGRALFLPSLHHYITKAVTKKVTLKEKDKAKLRALQGELARKDPIHSHTRLAEALAQTLELVTQLNGRNAPTNAEHGIVRDLFERSCRWQTQDELAIDHEVVLDAYEAHEERTPHEGPSPDYFSLGDAMD